MADIILEIKVIENPEGGALNLQWTTSRMEPGGGRVVLERKPGVTLKLGALERETINLLVRLQRLLSDTLQDRGQLALLLKDALPQPFESAGLHAEARELLDSDTPKKVEDVIPALVEVMGQKLFEVLFVDELKRDLMDRLRETREGLFRVELEFQGASNALRTMTDWPWEYLFIPMDPQYEECSGQFLALATRLVLSRCLSFTITEGWTFRLKERPKVLLVVSAPPRANLGGVVPTLTLEMIRKLAAEGVIQLQELVEPKCELPLLQEFRPTASFDSFKTQIKTFKPHVIHFVGHGQYRSKKGFLAFVDQGGQANWVDDEDFSNAVKESPDLKLVFLQACESALTDPHAPISGMARQLARKKVPAIVAMQSRVANNVADVFASRFYEVLADEKPVDYAVQAGREAIRAALKKPAPGQNEEREPDLTDFGVPVLYLRSYEGLIERQKGPAPLGGAGLPKCPSCGKPIKEWGSKFCIFCTLDLSWCCPNCRQPLDDLKDGQKLCGNCRWEVQLSQLFLRTAGPPVRALDPATGAFRAPKVQAELATGIRADSQSPPEPEAVPPQTVIGVRTTATGGG